MSKAELRALITACSTAHGQLTKEAAMGEEDSVDYCRPSAAASSRTASVWLLLFFFCVP